MYRSFHENRRFLLPTEPRLCSSVDAQLACACCGKGLVNGRPLVQLVDAATSLPSWLCLSCTPAQLVATGDLRRRYRRYYNQLHLSQLTDLVRCQPAPRQPSFLDDYLACIDADEAPKPALLAAVRREFAGSRR